MAGEDPTQDVSSSDRISPHPTAVQHTPSALLLLPAAERGPLRQPWTGVITKVVAIMVLVVEEQEEEAAIVPPLNGESSTASCL